MKILLSVQKKEEKCLINNHFNWKKIAFSLKKIYFNQVKLERSNKAKKEEENKEKKNTKRVERKKMYKKKWKKTRMFMACGK